MVSKNLFAYVVNIYGRFGLRVLEGRAYFSFLNYKHYKMYLKIN